MVNLESSYRGKVVFLTGHTGFKGSWLAEWLLSMGAQVVGFSLPPPTQPALFDQLQLAGRLQHGIGDIRNGEPLTRAIQEAQPDFVFHFAAQPLVRRSYRDPLDTWQTNVLGTIQVMEALRTLQKSCAAVLVTTDKVYENREWNHAYREADPLGGHDPYSSSKAASEIAIQSWRRSFFLSGHPVKIASARAGNVIGGGDWAEDRIVPDAVRALAAGSPILIRNPASTRPWQHVLEPLSGYLLLAARLAESALGAEAFNFGPALTSNRSVGDLVKEIQRYWPGEWENHEVPDAVHEAGKLNLSTDKAYHLLGWQPRWNFAVTVQKTVQWYQEALAHPDAIELLTRRQISEYCSVNPS